MDPNAQLELVRVGGLLALVIVFSAFTFLMGWLATRK